MVLASIWSYIIAFRRSLLLKADGLIFLQFCKFNRGEKMKLSNLFCFVLAGLIVIILFSCSLEGESGSKKETNDEVICQNNARKCSGTEVLLCQNDSWDFLRDCLDTSSICINGFCVYEGDGDMPETGDDDVYKEDSPLCDERAASCDGSILIFCQEGFFREIDCAIENMECRYDIDDERYGCRLPGSAGGGSNESGSPHFLSLPLKGSINLFNGWQYTCPPNGIGSNHQAVDFQTPIGTSMYAACSGVAMLSSQYANGTGYGRFLIIKCDQVDPSGSNYFALYGHVQEGAEEIIVYPSNQRRNTNYHKWTRVERGQYVGKTGSEDTSWPHLHFEIDRGGYAIQRTDPYDLYMPTTVNSNSADFYPPNGELFSGCGDHYLWTECPPVYIPFEDCLSDANGEIVSPDNNAEIENLSISGYANDADGIDKITVIVDNLETCRASVFPHGATYYEFVIDIDLADCGLEPGTTHKLNLWVRDECGSDQVRLVDSINFSYNLAHACVCDNPDAPCCDGCYFRPTTHICNDEYDTDYQCNGGGCGDDAQKKIQVRHCSGNSSSCTGETSWGGWTTIENCSSTERCSSDNNYYASCSYDTSCDCECSNGICCDGCKYRPSSYICDAENDIDYQCSGAGCGDDAQKNIQVRYCSGNSSTCIGETSWGGWNTIDNCSSTEKCSSDNNSYASCSYNASCDCECSSGVCCDGCNYLSEGSNCPGGVCNSNGSCMVLCGGNGQVCCGENTCDEGLVCMNATGTCGVDNTPTKKSYRFILDCFSSHWQGGNNTCFPGNFATEGCTTCTPSIVNPDCNSNTCWRREGGFWVYSSNPGYGSFSMVLHCFENDGNKYFLNRSTCPSDDDPDIIGWIADSPIGFWDDPVYLCEWWNGAATEQFFSLGTTECSSVGGIIVSGGPFGYIIP